MPNYVTPIMITLGIILGCLFLVLVMQVLNHVRIRQNEQTLLRNQEIMLNIIPQPVALEDLMMRDLHEGLPTEKDLDNLTLATDEEMLAMLEEMNTRRENEK